MSSNSDHKSQTQGHKQNHKNKDHSDGTPEHNCAVHGSTTQISHTHLFWAIVINVLLTVVQIIAGVFSGSLSLVADAFHNLSDAFSLVIAYTAEKVSLWPKTDKMTYGFGRAKIIGALVNTVALTLIAIYISYEVVIRFYNPKPIDGWIVIGAGFFALVIDLATAKLTHAGSKNNINLRAAFIHNLTDAMASVVVMISGALVLIFNIYIFDLIASLLISAFILYQSMLLLKSCVLILMQATPDFVDLDKVKSEILKVKNVIDIIDFKIWILSEAELVLDLKIKINSQDITEIFKAKSEVKSTLASNFNIRTSYIEIEI